MALPPMPLRSASNLTFFGALGYPIGALAVSTMSPMAVLVVRFGLAGTILSAWALIARVKWPTGRRLAHVLVTGLLTQALQFICLYLALMHGWLNARVSRQQRQDDPAGDGRREHRIDPVHDAPVTG